MSAYWQALLSTLEGKAADCAAWSLLRISIKKRSGCFLTPDMARRNIQRSAASFGVDGKQFVHPRHKSPRRLAGLDSSRSMLEGSDPAHALLDSPSSEAC